MKAACPILGAAGEVLEGSFRESFLETGQGYYQAAENRPAPTQAVISLAP
jgi:hypothetical protein